VDKQIKKKNNNINQFQHVSWMWNDGIRIRASHAGDADGVNVWWMWKIRTLFVQI